MDIIKKINKSDNPWKVISQLSIDELESALKIASDAYYNSDEPLITDEMYDIMIEIVKKLDPESSVLNKTGATIRGKKVKLPYWLGSMTKIKSDDKALQKWLNNHDGPYLISNKLDGISCMLHRFNGKTSLFTRGDGEYGQDISHLLNMISIPKKALENIKDTNISIRGELIMSIKCFKKYAKIMSNSRNMVAGIANSKRESVNKKHAKDVSFVTYEIITSKKKLSDQLELLDDLGFDVVDYDIYDDIRTEYLLEILEERKSSSKYMIDGIIVTDNKKHKRNISGNPTYSFAFKGSTPTADVKVLEVLWKPSKRGLIIPRIRYQPVRLSEANLEYTTGFNAKYIVDNGIGKGAIIKIVRSGDVIPYITRVIKSTKPDLPKEYDYEWDKNGVNIILKDADTDKTVIIQRLTNFAKNIGIDNMSEGIVTKLVNAGYDNIQSIIMLSVDDLLTIEGFKETLANKIYNNIQKAINDIDILKLMVASNLFGRGFGERKIKAILNVCPNIVNSYSEKNHDMWYDILMGIDGFDTITSLAFLDALPTFKKFYKDIQRIIDVKPYVVPKTDGDDAIFKDEIIAFTVYRNKSWEKIIEEKGGKVSGTVTGKTTILVYGQGAETTGKYVKAMKLGITMLTPQEFKKKFKLD